MNDEIKKLTRYDMTTEYNKYACEDVVRENAEPDGAWVKYSDVLAIAERTSSAGSAAAPTDEEVASICVKVRPDDFEQENGCVDFLRYDAAVVRAWLSAAAAQPAQAERQAAGAMSDEQISSHILNCWSCRKQFTMGQRTDADGNCPHCGAEYELSADEMAMVRGRKLLSDDPEWLDVLGSYARNPSFDAAEKVTRYADDFHSAAPLYAAAQAPAQIAAVQAESRDAALEEAAKLMEMQKGILTISERTTLRAAAAAIRALKSAAMSSEGGANG